MTYSLIDRLADIGTPTAEEAIAEIAAKDALIRELTDAGNNCRAFTALFSGSDQAMKLAVDDWDAAITRAKEAGYE